MLQQLTNYELLPEEWGGETPVVRVSAKTGEGVESLLENILIMAEIRELKANPDRPARGTIIEARLDKGVGKVATILVQTGTLKIGDNVVAGTSTGKIRAMTDDKGRKVKKAGPSTPVSVTGWDEVPEAGDIIDVVADEKFARELAEERRLKLAASSDDSGSAAAYGDLGIMDRNTSFVSEFKLGDFVWDMKYNGAVSAENRQTAIETLGPSETGYAEFETDLDEYTLFGIPFSSAIALTEMYDLEADETGHTPTNAEETNYPRNHKTKNHNFHNL